MMAVMPETPARITPSTLARKTRPLRASPLLLLLLLGAGTAAFAAKGWARRTDGAAQTRHLSERGAEPITAASTEPVKVALEAGRVFQIPGSRPNWLPGDHRIVFRVAAAAVVMLDLAEGRKGGQGSGFWLWSETLDPVRPADGGRVGARLRAGEYALRVEVTNAVGVSERRERILRSEAGVAPVSPAERERPCDVREDPELGMLVARTPEGVRHFDACGFRTGGAITEGRSYRPANFMKLAPDGTPKFVVKCSVHVTAADYAPPSACQMQGDFGAWPLFLWVRSDRAPEWDATFERVRDYLARQTVARTD